MESPFIDLPVRESKETESSSLAEVVAAHSPFGEVEGFLVPDPWVALKPLLATLPPAPVTVQTPSRWLSLIRDTVTGPAEPLLHGAETYKRMVSAIRTASNSSHYIYILGWMLDADFEMIPGDSSSTLYNLLREASRKGVEIRVQIWNNLFYQTEINNALTRINSLPNALMVKDSYTYGSPGVKRAIATMRVLINSAPSILDQLSAWKEFKDALNIVQNEGAHHEKVVVVKGSEGLIGFCGGIDINPNRVGGVDSQGRSRVLHDVHCELRGFGAWMLLHRFMWRWQVLKEVYYWMPPLANCINEPKPGDLPGPDSAHVKVIQTYNHPAGNIKDRSIRETVRIAIENARQTIHIEDQYMISLEIATWLNRKLKEPGFRSVSFLTQDDSYAKPDLQFPKAMRKKFIDTLCLGLSADEIKRKVFIQMLHPDSPPGSHHLIHSKIYVIDDELAIIGSANCSSRSMTHDSETAAVIFNDPGTPLSFVKKLQGRMNYDPLQHIVPYVPNPDVKDRDVELAEDIQKYSGVATLVGGLLTLGSPVGTLVGPILTRLIPALKPTFIDIIDPDADGTIPQQELGDLSNEAASENSFETRGHQESNAVGQYELPVNQPASIPRRALDPSTFLSPEKNTKATNLNQKQVQKSGLSIADIVAALTKHVDIAAVQAALIARNGSGTTGQYNVAGQGVPVVDAVLTEAVHQFQRANFIDPREHDGILGVSTLDTLDFIRHGLRPTLDSRGFWGQKQLNRSDLRPQVSQLTNSEFTNANWFEYILRPSWMGVKIASGVHVLLLRKLQEAENWLKQQQQYAGMTPAEMGRALGFTPTTGYSASRLSASPQAMHAFGLAIDIYVWGNPWIGAGWISGGEEGPHMIKTLRAASGDPSLPGRTVFAYLHSIAQSTGNDTWRAYDTLKQRNDEFISYLRNNKDELSYWRKSYTFGGRNPLDGFLNLHRDLVYALRQIAGLAWGAMDFGPYASGDIMHFDSRTLGVGKMLSENSGGFVPRSGHPTIRTEAGGMELEFHEAINEAQWQDVNELDGDGPSAGSHNLEIDEYDRRKAMEESSPQLGQEDFVETETVTPDWSRAVRLNRYYAASLGWDRFYDQINNLLLPFSGQENVSLGEEAFAQALAKWQQQQGFAEKDVDGILGPHTWARMQVRINLGYVPPVVSTGNTYVTSPSIQNMKEFNGWHAQKVLDSMMAGYVGQAFDSKGILEKIAHGEQVLKVNPNTKIIQILPVMSHIAEQARLNNYREIIFGSFIRGADSDGSCTGHCEGRCIDINHTGGSFENPGSLQMVTNILTYLLSLPAQYKKPLGFGMPLQGDFFGHADLRKFHSVDPSLLKNTQLVQLVSQLGYVFPDNNNHLHIQIKWSA
jgi:phosphatidylserine/phosphatidylglycerophosphate/cardiolipin synthase-like enzyme